MNSDDESYAPTFKQSFSADFDHMFAQMSVSKDQQDDDNPNNGETGENYHLEFLHVIGYQK